MWGAGFRVQGSGFRVQGGVQDLHGGSHEVESRHVAIQPVVRNGEVALHPPPLLLAPHPVPAPVEAYKWP